MLRCSIIVICMLIASLAQGGVEFYVAPGGDDANPGTRERPFATLDHARLVVARRADRSGPVTVFLAEGTYYLPDTLVFQAADSGSKDAPITLCRAARPNSRDQRWSETPAFLVLVQRRHYAGSNPSRHDSRSALRKRPAPNYGALS